MIQGTREYIYIYIHIYICNMYRHRYRYRYRYRCRCQCGYRHGFKYRYTYIYRHIHIDRSAPKSHDCHSTLCCLSFFLCGRAFSFLFLFPLNCAALVLECKWNWINVSTELLQFQFFCDVRSKGNTEDFPFPPSLLEEK